MSVKHSLLSGVTVVLSTFGTCGRGVKPLLHFSPFVVSRGCIAFVPDAFLSSFLGVRVKLELVSAPFVGIASKQ